MGRLFVCLATMKIILIVRVVVIIVDRIIIAVIIIIAAIIVCGCVVCMYASADRHKYDIHREISLYILKPRAIKSDSNAKAN